MNLRTNHWKFDWKTPSPSMQNSWQSAFKRDLVVVVCQPPSKMVMSVSETSAILLPWRRTTETPVSGSKWTEVFADYQSMFFWTAAHIWDSILRMMKKRRSEVLVAVGVWSPPDEHIIDHMGCRSTSCVPLSSLAHYLFTFRWENRRVLLRTLHRKNNDAAC